MARKKPAFQERDPLKGTLRRWENARRPRTLDTVLGGIRSGLSEELDAGQLAQYWKELVGSEIGALTWIENLRAGTLSVGVKPGPWRMELLPLAGELAEGLNLKLGRRLVRRIRFVERI